MKTFTENPIAAQSKQWFLQALFELMEKKDFKNISIKELSEKAGLDRKTFYRNFNSKDDVVNMRLQELCRLYTQKLLELPQLSAYAVTQVYFTICAQHKDFFMILKEHNLLPLALMKFNEYLPQINTLFLKNPAYRNKSDYELLYQAGGFWNVTIHWLSNGAVESPEEMAKMISAIMPSTLQ